MMPRQAMVYLLWFGEKTLAGGEPTEEELARFKECRQMSIGMAKKFFRIKDEEFAYKDNEPFPGM